MLRKRAGASFLLLKNDLYIKYPILNTRYLMFVKELNILEVATMSN